MVEILSGKAERLPYSLSRWTDLPAAKWDWFETQLDQGWMEGFDPRTAVPCNWSLKPEDTYGLVFWTKDPTNLILTRERLLKYPLVIHMTLTGWDEVEHGAPDMAEGLAIMANAISAFGHDRVVWRFSPVPATPDIVDRFETMARAAAFLGLKRVYVSFLQENDLMPEKRPSRVRVELLKQMSVRSHGMKILLCNEDQTLARESQLPPNLEMGVCEDGCRFTDSVYHIDRPRIEGCGCALAVDPFTINESCTMGCEYCYAADKSRSPSKRNTTRLRVVR